MSSYPKGERFLGQGGPGQEPKRVRRIVEAEDAASAGEARAGAYLRAALDCVVMVDAAGRIVEFNPAAERTFGYTREQALGQMLSELIVPPSLRALHSGAFARFVETREERLFGRRLQLTGMRADGTEFPVELALSRVEGEPLLVCGALRDLSDPMRAEDDLRRLAQEQSALHRVATLVARAATPGEVFAAVAEEIALVLDVPRIAIMRYEGAETAIEVGGWSRAPEFSPVGTRWSLDAPSVTALVAQTGRPARVDDYSGLPGPVAETVRNTAFATGIGAIRTAVGAPVVVDGQLWGAVVALSTDPDPFPEHTENRLGSFTELVATAISNTHAREELRQLADQQAALRRVATLVARSAPTEDLFAAVAEEAALILDVPYILIHRFEPDATSTVIGVWGRPPMNPGDRFTLDAPSVMASVFHTGRPARIQDYSDIPGPLAALARKAGIRSGVGVPVIVNGRTWGAIVAAGNERAPLPDSTEARLAGFTELVATAIANAQARDEIRRLADQQAALRRVATLVATQARTEELFGAVAEEVAQVTGIPLVELSRYEPDKSTTVIGAWGDHPFSVGTCWPHETGTLSALVLQTGRPARIDDYGQVRGAIGAAAQERGGGTAVAVPILVGGTVWGIVAAGWTDREPLPEDTEARLAEFTELVATAISNTQARDDLRELANEQAALRRVATLVARETSPEIIFAAVAEEVARALDVPLVSTVRYEPDGSATEIGGWSERGNPFPLGTRWTLDGPSVMALVRRSGRPARIDDYADLPGTVAEVVRVAEIRSAVGVPILVDGSLWGVMVALSDESDPLPAGTEKRLADFIELAATAISNTQARDDVRRLAYEQAALHRVATLVAQRAPPAEVFATVMGEVGNLLQADLAQLYRYEDDRTAVRYVASWSSQPTAPEYPPRLTLEGRNLAAMVRETGKPARIDDYWAAPGAVADQLVRPLGIRAGIGCPVVVDGKLWGVMAASTREPEPFPPGAEARLAGFTELVATAISNADTHAALIASRARIVTAADEARRRVERDLHDGTQQRLVSLGLELQALQTRIPAELADLGGELESATEVLEEVLEDVREISRGLHPATLAHTGLASALKALARRAAVPVELDVAVEGRLPESIEVAAYYVVSEALTNVAKHASASAAAVKVTQSGDVLRASVRDDGIGGAVATAGSGLGGLEDRVEALGGRFELESPAGQGTAILVELPLVDAAVARDEDSRPSAEPPGRAAVDHPHRVSAWTSMSTRLP